MRQTTLLFLNIVAFALPTYSLESTLDQKIQAMKDTAQFVAAIKSNNAAEVRNLLRNGINVDTREEDGTPVFYLAAINESTGVLSVLLDNGVDINAKKTYGGTALEAVVARASADDDIGKRLSKTIKIILSKKNSSNNTPLADTDGLVATAAMNGSYEIVNILLENGAQVESKKIGVVSPISLGACNGRDSDKIVSVLIKYGASVNRKNKDSEDIPVIMAAQCGTAVLATLIKAKADLEVKTASGDTPLLIALKRRDHDMENAELLISNNVDVNVTDDFGNSPLILAVKSEEGNKIVKLLISKKADLNKRDKNGRTALGWALWQLEHALGEKDYSVSEMLSKAGAIE